MTQRYSIDCIVDITQFPKNGRLFTPKYRFITPLTFDHTVKILFTPKCRLDHTRAPKPISQRGLQARWARANPLLQPLPTAAVRGSRRLMVMWGWGEKTSRASRSLGHICFDLCERECARVGCICAVYVCVCVSVYACMCDCVCVCVCVCERL